MASFSKRMLWVIISNFLATHRSLIFLRRFSFTNKLANVTVLNFALDFTSGKAILFGSEKPGRLNKSLIRSSDRPIGTTIDSKRLSEFIDHPIDLFEAHIPLACGRIPPNGQISEI